MKPFTDLEILALDLFFLGQEYVNDLACSDEYVTFNALDVTSWARVISNDWANFENQVEEHFHIPQTLNDTLTLIGVQSISINDYTFYTAL